MSVQPSNDVTWQGQIYYKQRATFAQYHIFWGMLCRESGRGPKRLDLYDKRGVTPITTIPLTDVLHIDSRATRSNKHSFQVLATGTKFHFATKTAHDREQWIKHLNSLLFGPPMPGIVYEFQVQVLSNSHADQLHLQGKYILNISSSEIALTCANGKLPTRFHCGLTEILRTRYTTFMDAGQQFSVLVIYTKGSSEVGEGTFVFRALSAADISRVIDHRVKELCQDSAVESLSKTLNLSSPPPPHTPSSKTLPRSQSPLLPSPHRNEIFEYGRSKTASVPNKRLNISLDSNDPYVHFTKIPKSHLPLPDESGYSASVDSSDFHRASFLPVNPLYRHLSSPKEPLEDSSYDDVVLPHSAVSPLSEDRQADDLQTLRSVACSSDTHEVTGVQERYREERYREERVSYSPERRGLQQGGGGEAVDYVNVQRGSVLIQPVREPVAKPSKPPVPLPRKKQSSVERVKTTLSHNSLTGNHSDFHDDRKTSTEDRVSKGGGEHLIGRSSNAGPPTRQPYVNFTVFEETEKTTSEHATETFEDPASWISSATSAREQQRKISKTTDPSRSSVTMAMDWQLRAESAYSPLQDPILPGSDLDLEEAHNYLRILPPDTIPSSHIAGIASDNNTSVMVAADEQPRPESANSSLLDPDSDLDLEEAHNYLRILPPDTIPSSHTASGTSDSNAVERLHPDPVLPLRIRSPTSDLESSPLSGGNCDSPLWGDMDSPNFESLQLPSSVPENSEHRKHPPTFLSPAFPHVPLKAAHSTEILPTLGSSLPAHHQMYIHQLLTHSTSAQASTSKWQCSSENRTSDDEEELEVVGDAFHKEDMLQSKPVESQRSSPESDFMSMDGIAQLNLNGKTSIPPLNQPKATRPDHLDDVFVRDTESDDGYTELLSIPEIDSYGYSKPKPPVPQCTEQSDAGPSPFTSSHQYSISHRPPAPLPHSEGMTPVVNMQPFSRERGYHYSLKRVRSHSDGNLSRYSDIYDELDIWYDYAKISKTPITLSNQIAGYCDINRQQPEEVPGNQQPVLSAGYDRLPLKTVDNPESSHISDLQVDQSDWSTSQVTVDHSEPDWGEVNGTDQLHSNLIEVDQSSAMNQTDQSDLRSGFDESDHSDLSSFNQTDHSTINASQTDKSDLSVSKTDQSDSRVKKPPPVYPKPPRSSIKFETPI